MSGVLDITDAVKTKTKADAVLRKPFGLQALYAAVGEDPW
jgi:hypothetical protein